MIIIGIDPGTALTGYAVLDIQQNKRKPKLVDCAVVKTPSGRDMHKRLEIIYNEMTDIVETHTPEVMIVEKLFFNTNVKTAMSVGQARGVPLLVAAKKNVHIMEYTALQAKMVLTGYGRSTKKEVQNAVKDYFGLEEIVKPDDANDAIAMALCFLHKDYEKYKKDH